MNKKLDFINGRLKPFLFPIKKDAESRKETTIKEINLELNKKSVEG